MNLPARVLSHVHLLQHVTDTLLGVALVGESDMEGGSSAFAPAVLKSWSQRKNLLPGLALVALAAAGWVYVAYQSNPMGSTESMAMDGTGGGVISSLAGRR